MFLVENLRTSIPFDMAEYINRFLAVGFASTITSKREQVSQAVVRAAAGRIRSEDSDDRLITHNPGLASRRIIVVATVPA